MKKIHSMILAVLVVAVSFFAVDSYAGNVANSTTGVQGYDLVSYHTEGKAVRGSGTNLVVVDDVTYLFATEDNKKAFEANPEKYLPAYGGYCAYGVALGKKFVGDAEIWEIVDGTLYLNLAPNVQEEWKKDVPGNIQKANSNWPGIKDKAPSDL